MFPRGGGRHVVWQGGMHGSGHAWWGDMSGRGACKGGMHGGVVFGRGHAWQGACVSGGMYGGGGHVWQGACMAGEMATAADRTYPTGMHSCFSFFLVFHLFRFCS